jgi:radical SAM superfamily enzyme YgiQ (UPF0313 family)
MKILFLNPPFKGRFSRTSRSPAVAAGGTLYYPFWLAYAAGVAEQAGHEVMLLDSPAESLGPEETLARIRNFSPGLLVADTSTPSLYSDAAFAAEIKRLVPDCFVTLVGTHPSALPEETLALSPLINGVAVGEYDYTMRDLAAALEAGTPLRDVAGLVFRENWAVVRNLDRPRIKNLDELPFVSSVYKKHLDCRNYFFAAARYPMAMIITGRGCPFSCFFCVYPQVFHSRKYRPRSPGNVVAEFEYVKANLPDVKEIGIEDDCFTASPARVREICRLLIERKVGMTWYCNARGDVDRETLELMRQAGCRLVVVGFESGNQSVLDGMHKKETVEDYHRFAADAQRAGIMVHGCLMCGTPGDSPATQEDNYRFAKKINCDSMQFYPLYVYPGTEAYQWARDNRYLRTENFSEWLKDDGSHNCVIDTDSMTAEEMMAICSDNLRSYHLRPRYLFMKLIQALKNPEEGLRSLKSGWIFLKKIVWARH